MVEAGQFHYGLSRLVWLLAKILLRSDWCFSPTFYILFESYFFSGKIRNYFSYVTRLDFDENELGTPYSKSVAETRAEVLKVLEETVKDDPVVADDPAQPERLSPKLEKMILNSPKVEAPIKRSKSPPKMSETKKSKKKVAFTTISNA